MYNILLLLIYILINIKCAANKTTSDSEITCRDFKKLSAGMILYYTQSLADNKTQVIIFLSTNHTKAPFVINLKKMTSIKDIPVDPTKRTYFIIHGFHASSNSKWVIKLRDKILKLVSNVLYRSLILKFNHLININKWKNILTINLNFYGQLVNK